MLYQLSYQANWELVWRWWELHRHRRGHRFESRSSLNFSQAFFSQLLQLRINCEHLSSDLINLFYTLYSNFNHNYLHYTFTSSKEREITCRFSLLTFALVRKRINKHYFYSCSKVDLDKDLCFFLLKGVAIGTEAITKATCIVEL